MPPARPLDHYPAEEPDVVHPEVDQEVAVAHAVEHRQDDELVQVDLADADHLEAIPADPEDQVDQTLPTVPAHLDHEVLQEPIDPKVVNQEVVVLDLTVKDQVAPNDKTTLNTTFFL